MFASVAWHVDRKAHINQVKCSGLKIEEHELVDLTELAYGDSWRGVYPSAGGSGIKVFNNCSKCDPYILTTGDSP
jgi:hypothetical protein